MVKQEGWRKDCPKSVRELQILALEIDTLLVMRQVGPLAYSIQDINEDKPFEVSENFLFMESRRRRRPKQTRICIREQQVRLEYGRWRHALEFFEICI